MVRQQVWKRHKTIETELTFCQYSQINLRGSPRCYTTYWGGFHIWHVLKPGTPLTQPTHVEKYLMQV